MIRNLIPRRRRGLPWALGEEHGRWWLSGLILCDRFSGCGPLWAQELNEHDFSLGSFLSL